MNTYYNFSLLLLGSFFFIVGLVKISKPKQKLFKAFPWTKDFRPATIKFIGFLEFSASLGLAGPMVIGFGHYLTSYAALGICIVMVLAGIYHSRRKEFGYLFINAMILFLSFYIIVGNYKA